MTDEQQTDPSEAAHRVLNAVIDQYGQREWRTRGISAQTRMPVLSTTQEVWDAIEAGAKQSGNWIGDPHGGISEYRGCRVVVLRRYGMWAEAITPAPDPSEQLAATFGQTPLGGYFPTTAWSQRQMDQMPDRCAVARCAVRLAAAPLPPCHHSGGGREKAAAGILERPISSEPGPNGEMSRNERKP